MSDSPIRRPLAVSAVPPEGLEVEVVADAAELEAIARHNDAPSLESFQAKLRVTHFGPDGLAVRGVVEAAATRTCVVTLEPFAESVRQEVDVRFSPDAPADGEATSDDPPDPLVGGSIDLGAIASEFFTLGLDPYPRKPGATFEGAEAGGDLPSPFAALARLKGGSGQAD